METSSHVQKLLKERARLLEDLGRIGLIDRKEGNEWVPKGDDLNIDPADDLEIAEKVGEFEERVVVEEEIEEELKEVEQALERVAAGTFGTCLVCQKPIEENRILANPSASTCLLHKK